jgi:predicted small integral membrane protein
MLDTVLVLAQIAAVLGPAAWLTTGVWDNYFYPQNNEVFTAQVMSLQRMRDEYPTEHARVAHRAVHDRRLQVLAFRTVLLAEFLAAILLWTGAVLLVVSLAGAVAHDTARALALFGATAFTSVWAGFLVVGNYFCYWFCHGEGQNTHYQMTLWGLGTMIFLVVS